MKINDLYPAVLTFLLITILIGIGVTVLGNFSTEVRTTVTATDDTFTASNASCVAIGTYIDTASAAFNNASATVASSCFTWDDTGRRSGTCVTLNSGACSTAYQGVSVNATYTYGTSTTAQTSVDSGVTAVSGFVTWFSILVVIIAAAIIIGLVLRSFSGR